MAQSLESDLYINAPDSADAVMDELFGDMEKTLQIEKAKILPARSNSAVTMDELGLENLDLQDDLQDQVMWLSPHIHEPSQPDPPPPTRNWLTVFLFVSACGSALLAGIVWSLHLSGRLTVPDRVVTARLPEAIDPRLQQFRTDIRELLSFTPPPNPPSESTLPPPPLSAPLSPLPPPQTVFVPVHQSPVAALPPVADNGAANTAPKVPQNDAPAPAPQSTLVGVLNFGDQATAMFELGGTVETIPVGSPVGDTGWTLAKVQQRDVVLRRNNETKSVLVGQKF